MNEDHKKLLKFLDKFKGFQWYGNDRATKKIVDKLVDRNFCIKRKTILDNGYIFREVKRAQKGKMKQSIIKECEHYIGNRGIDRPIKKCAEYKNLWFIVFKDYPKDIEVSVKALCYECYTEIPINNMKWNNSYFEKIKQQLKI